MSLLLGGHSRFVNLFMSDMRTPDGNSCFVSKSVKEILESNDGVVAAVEAERNISVAVTKAGKSRRLQPLWSRFPGGADGAFMAFAHVLLAHPVESSDRVLELVDKSSVDGT